MLDTQSAVISAMSVSERFVRAVNESPDVCNRLQRGADLAAELVDGCDYAVVASWGRRCLRPVAWTDHRAARIIEFEMNVTEGPSLTSLQTGRTVISGHVDDDRRWPRWARHVSSRHGIRSVLTSVVAGYDQQGRPKPFGTLTLHSGHLDSFDRASLQLTQEFATSLGIAATTALEIQQRGEAMESRTIIGEAIGIVMERFNLDADRAFGVLRRLSQANNRRISDLAAELVHTRDSSVLHG